jgi:hypothetical protein
MPTETEVYKEMPNRLEGELITSPKNEPEEKFTRIKHSVNLGDLYAAMGSMKKYWECTGRKVVVVQTVGTLANYYAGAVHPTVNDNGQAVCMNNQMWEMVKPLIEHQEYIHSFESYTGQEIHLDFDTIRGKTFVNLPHGAIQYWIPLAFPDLSFDMSLSWMEVNGKCPEHISKQVKGKVIINFTERYRNTMLDYFFLQNYAPDLIFAGTEKEHFLFCNRWGLNIPRLEITDFLELGYALKECRFLMSNQSQSWNLAEALKTPRVLEICSFAQNCIAGVGKESHGYLHQVGAEYHFRRLYNITK